jgi:exo-1,4-beta-D-glucosaminidase
MIRALVVFCAFAVSAFPQTGRPPGVNTSRIGLAKGWAIQSSAKVPRGGAEISSPGFDTGGWHRATVPSTVVSTLVDNGLYPDPYLGMNLRLIPGTTYDLGDNFAVDPMPADSPFIAPWWYRTEFKLPAAGSKLLPGLRGKRLWLNFDSINYRAEIWLNGRRIAGSDQVRGLYRRYEFDIAGLVVPGTNALALEVFAPTENDLSIAFVDWNPLPADKDMGLVGRAYILTSGPVTLRHPQVAPQLDSSLAQARLSVYADLTNASAEPVEGTLEGAIGDIAISQPVRLVPGESARVVFDPLRYPQLNIRDPRLWWPYNLGPQNLYSLHLVFRSGGVVSDASDVEFGIREITSELDSLQHRVFRINGKRILIRGAAWTPDMMLRMDEQREEYDVRYAREMNLNAIRLEGKLEMSDHFFEAADRLGVLVMPGWCCCSYWEQWEKWQPSDYVVAGESLRSQVRRLRNHPSVFVFLYGSDSAPDVQAEQVYLDVLRQENWTNPYLAAASDNTTPGAGRTGVKMTGPYEYVAPGYWLEDTQHGGAFGFITETSPGPAIPLVASLSQFLPKDHLWPVDDVWNFHAGSGSYADIRVFTAAMDNRYGPAKDLDDFVKKSQVMTYEGQRAMFEAYGRNKYVSTGVIQWMLNNAWPGLVWHLYDWYLRPGGGYFGTKKANEPVHVQYSYDDRSVVVVNSLYREIPGCRVTATVYNLDLTEKFSQTVAIRIPEDSATRVIWIPAIDGLSRTYFVRLALDDADGNRLSSNFYWLSTTPDVFDWPATEGRYTPLQSYADLTDLQSLPPARVTAAWQVGQAFSPARRAESRAAWGSETADTEQTGHVLVRNESQQLAFSVHLTLLKGKGGADVAPVYWDDNYFELMPGESRQVTVTYARKLLSTAEPYVQVDGWNVTGQ